MVKYDAAKGLARLSAWLRTERVYDRCQTDSRYFRPRISSAKIATGIAESCCSVRRKYSRD